MRTRIYTLAAAVAIAAIGVSVAVAQPGKGVRQHPRVPRMEALDLTAEQKDKLQDLRTEQAKAMARLQADVKVARIELQELLRDRSSTQSSVKKAVQKASAAQAKTMESNALHRLAVNQVLTDEQIEKMQELRGPRGRRGRGGGPRGFGGAMMYRCPTR